MLTQLETLSANLPNIVRMASIGLTAFLVWMAIAQLGLFTQGWELLTENKKREEVEVKEEEKEPEKAAEQAEEVQAPSRGKQRRSMKRRLHLQMRFLPVELHRLLV